MGVSSAFNPGINVSSAHLNVLRWSIVVMVYCDAFHSHGAADEKVWSLYVLSLVFWDMQETLLTITEITLLLGGEIIFCF